jgi:hypothetical protein
MDKVNPKLATNAPPKMVDIPIVSTVETKKLVSTFTDKQKSDAMVPSYDSCLTLKRKLSMLLTRTDQGQLT